MQAAEPDFLPRLAGFARLLHDAGLQAGPGRLAGAAGALGLIDLRREDDFREALRASFVARREENALFDAAFDLYWAPPSSTRRTWRRRARTCPSWSPSPVPAAVAERPRADLLPRLATFARLLHDAGLEAGPGRLTDSARALGHIGTVVESGIEAGLEVAHLIDVE